MSVQTDDRKLKILLLVSLALLAGLEAISALVNDVDSPFLIVADLSPYILAFAVVWALASFTDGKILEKVILTAASLALLYECGTGVMQIFGKASSGNLYYNLTGDFRNPGPYGGFIAVMLAAILPAVSGYRKDKSLKHNALPLLAGFASIIGIVLLPATLSRTAFVAFGTAALLYMLRIEQVRRFIGRRKWVIGAAALVILSVSVILFNFKRESADGRLHIWKIEVMTMAERPLSGYGPGMALGGYGQTQAHYFQTSGPFSQEEIRTAGVPEFAFNEYLRFGMECGLPGLALSVLILLLALVLLHRRKSPLEYALLALGVFASASYPLSLWQFRLVLAIILGFAAGSRDRAMSICASASALLSAILLALSLGTLSSVREAARFEKRAKLSITFGSGDIDSEDFAERLPYMSNNAHFLYDYAVLLRKEKKFQESIKIAEMGSRISADPIFNIAAGQSFADMKQYAQAEDQYRKAYYKVPCRITPLFHLMLMHLDKGDDNAALEVAGRISTMQVNRKVHRMVMMKEKAVQVRDSLSAAAKGHNL